MKLNLVLKRIAFAIWNHWATLSSAMLDRSTEKRYLDAAEWRISCRTAVRSNPLHIAFYVYLLLVIFRLMFALYGLRTGDYLAQYLDVDVVLGLLYDLKQFDYLAAICIVPLPIFMFDFDFAIHFRRYNYIVNLWHDIMVRNCKRFWILNAHLRPPFIRQLFEQPITSLRRLWTIAKQFYRYDASRNEYGCGGPVRFDQPYLKYYPYLSVIARLRFVAFNCFMNLFNSACIVGLFLCIVICWLYYLCFVFIPNIEPTCRKLTTLIIDSFIMLLYATNIIRVVLFLVQILISASLAGTYVYLELERKFRRKLQRFAAKRERPCISLVGHNQRSSHNISSMMRFLDFFRTQQTQMVMHVVQANRHFVSHILRTHATSNFLANIYLINALYFLSLTIADRILILGVIALQIGFTAIAMLPMLWLIHLLHRSAKSMLVRAQLHCLRRSSGSRTSAAIIRAKIKLLTQYELMHTDKRFYFTVGSMAEISGRSIFEFYFFYSGYLMFFFSMIQTSYMAKAN